MKTLLEKLENLIAEYKEKLQESENANVQLSELNPGEGFETSFGDMIVLEHVGDKTKVITKGFTKESQRLRILQPQRFQSIYQKKFLKCLKKNLVQKIL